MKIRLHAPTIVFGAVLLALPALVNGYPIVFSDTGAFLAQAAQPDAVFDKPWAYAPFLLMLHGRTTLWLPLAAQCWLLSYLLWRVRRVLTGRAGWIGHGLLCLVLAATTAAPFVASLLMPDVFAPVTVLCLFLIGWGRSLHPAERGALAVLAGFAIATHPTHLPIAAACLLPVCALTRRWRPVLPLVAAIGWLLTINTIEYGRPSLSPYGSVFLLARLVADGPAAAVIQADCPASGDRLCGWADHLPRDSDQFLWAPDGPVWAHGFGPTLIAPEASRLVARTILLHPIATAQAMALNTWRQAGRAGIGDTLGPDWLADTVALRLRQQFPVAEQARFASSLQAQGRLSALAVPWRRLQAPALLLGGLGCLIAGGIAWRRRDWRALGWLLTCLAGLIANAAATGALSGPHDRYGARMAWLLVAAPLVLAGRISDSRRRYPD